MPPLHLGDFEFAILLAVGRLGDDAYGAAIRRDLVERGGREVAVGAIHTTLARAEEKGMLRSTLSDPLPVRGGRARRCYVLTSAGREAVRAAGDARDRLLGKGEAAWRTS